MCAVSWRAVTETLRGAGFDDAAIAAAFGAIVGGESASFAAGVLHAAQEQLDNPALFEVLLLEAQQARELQPVEKETVDVESR